MEFLNAYVELLDAGYSEESALRLVNESFDYDDDEWN